MTLHQPEVNSGNERYIRHSVARQININLASPMTETIFHDKDGLPIKLSVTSTATVMAVCRHGVEHLFRIPARSQILWQIKGGLSEGAFKVGHGTDAEYRHQDSGGLVIFCPPRDRFDRGGHLETEISVSVSSGGDLLSRTIRIRMSREGRIGRMVSYRASVELSPEDGSPALENNPGRQGSSELITSCKTCNMLLNVEPSKKLASINLHGYFITSELVKVNAIEACGVPVLSGYGYDLYPVNSVLAEPTLSWQCTSGTFPLGNTGESVIYMAPAETELSKSPVTLTLYAFCNPLGGYEQNAVDRKKVWLLRRPAVMGG